jgi:hypothetical protein
MAFTRGGAMLGDQKGLNEALKTIGDRHGLVIKATIFDDTVSHLSMNRSQLVVLWIGDAADERELAPPKARFIGAFRRLAEGFSRFGTDHHMTVALVNRAPGRIATPSHPYPPLDAMELYDEYMASKLHDAYNRQNTICLRFEQDLAAPRA